MHKYLYALIVGLGATLLITAGTACGPPTEIRAGATVGTTVGTTVGSPSLVYLEPGLWVVAESEWPIFYTDGFYWLHRDGLWYQSTYYWGGWRYAQQPRVPRIVRRIQRPRSYVRYRPSRGQRVRQPPVSRDRRGRVRRPPRRRNEVVPSRRGG